MTIYQYKKIQISLLLVEKISILAKYLDFRNVFSKKSAKIWPKQIEANKYTIELKKNIEPSYRPI